MGWSWRAYYAPRSSGGAPHDIESCCSREHTCPAVAKLRLPGQIHTDCQRCPGTLCGDPGTRRIHATDGGRRLAGFLNESALQSCRGTINGELVERETQLMVTALMTGYVWGESVASDLHPNIRKPKKATRSDDLMNGLEYVVIGEGSQPAERRHDDQRTAERQSCAGGSRAGATPPATGLDDAGREAGAPAGAARL
jgi:hypothetical protein